MNERDGNEIRSHFGMGQHSIFDWIPNFVCISSSHLWSAEKSHRKIDSKFSAVSKEFKWSSKTTNGLHKIWLGNIKISLLKNLKSISIDHSRQLVAWLAGYSAVVQLDWMVVRFCSSFPLIRIQQWESFCSISHKLMFINMYTCFANDLSLHLKDKKIQLLGWTHLTSAMSCVLNVIFLLFSLTTTINRYAKCDEKVMMLVWWKRRRRRRFCRHFGGIH